MRAVQKRPRIFVTQPVSERALSRLRRVATVSVFSDSSRIIPKRKLIAAVRKAGAAVSLISDGDVAGVIHTAQPDKTGIDIYLGIGGAPEGVLAAAALRCIGGQMQTRLVVDTDEKRERVVRMGIKDPRKKYQIEDMVRGDCLFAATGVTDGPMLSGVNFGKGVIETETVVMRSVTGTVRWIRAEHRQVDKF